MAANPKPSSVKYDSVIHNMWEDLSTFNLPMSKREELKQALQQWGDQYTAILEGRVNEPIEEVQAQIDELDMNLSIITIHHAKDEISKREHGGAPYQALENVGKDLQSGKLTPREARHRVKDIMRSH